MSRREILRGQEKCHRPTSTAVAVCEKISDPSQEVTNATDFCVYLEKVEFYRCRVRICRVESLEELADV